MNLLAPIKAGYIMRLSKVIVLLLGLLIGLAALTACGVSDENNPVDRPDETKYALNEPEVADPGPVVLRPPNSENGGSALPDNDLADPSNPEPDVISLSPAEKPPGATIFGGYADLARVVLVVDKAIPGASSTGQTLTVFKNGLYFDSYPVSTGQEKKLETPSGKARWSATPLGYWFWG